MFRYLDIEKSIPRWSILLVDVLLCLFSVFLAYLLRFNFDIPEIEIDSFLYVIPSILAIRTLSFYVFRTYAGIIRHTSMEDGVKIFFTISVGSSAFVIANIIRYYFFQKYLIPFSVIIIDYFVTVFFIGAFRVLVKLVYYELKYVTKKKTNVVIYGVGDAVVQTKRVLESDPTTNYKVIAFVADGPLMVDKKIEGATIYNDRIGMYKILKTRNVDLLVISSQNISQGQKQRIIDLCLRYKVKVLDVPPMTKWINGELSFSQIKEVKIEDLLGRKAIKLNRKAVKEQLKDKSILITGAAGSIGGGLVKQIAAFAPQKLILLDNAETPLYNLEFELNKNFKMVNFETIIGDIRNIDRMEKVFKEFKPHYVYHAAAYKHVPLMELNPSEAILTNIEGTKILADMSIKYGVEKFVMISTDKAVNPTNIMGASKRIAEIYVQSLYRKFANNKKRTKYITTRFGNVLGSNGSVIQLFRSQIESGGPITVTHPEVTRYFMTIPEACQLVLEAGAMGKGGEIYIFDMGNAIRITDLAKKMVALSGLELNRDIQIEYTGLRPGEKLYEELLNNEENTIPTHHNKILIAKVREYNNDVVKEDIEELIRLFKLQDNIKIVKKMKSIVPEFVSNNSVYETLDAVNVMA